MVALYERSLFALLQFLSHNDLRLVKQVAPFPSTHHAVQVDKHVVIPELASDPLFQVGFGLFVGRVSAPETRLAVRHIELVLHVFLLRVQLLHGSPVQVLHRQLLMRNLSHRQVIVQQVRGREGWLDGGLVG